MILGHSGCGESTIMNTNILAAATEATSGTVKTYGQEMKGPGLDRGVLFQDYSLLPWLSTFKALIQVRFSDGIMSAIGSGISLTRIENPKRNLVKVGIQGKSLATFAGRFR